MASQDDGLTSVGDPHQSSRSHRNTEGIQTKRSKTWTKTHKKVMEIMSGLCIHTAPDEKLSVEEIIKKADVMFKNMQSPSTKNQNFAVRLRNVLSNSHFFFPLQNASSASASVWELAADKIADFEQMVNTFVEENSELAEEHEIKNSSHYRRSRKRGSNAISTPDAVKSSVPKKKKPSVKTDAKGKRTVLPTERTKPHFSSLPKAVGQMKNKVATASALTAPNTQSTPARVEFDVEKETSRAPEIDTLSDPRKYEELFKNLLGLQDIEKDIIALVAKKEEERMRFYQEHFSRFEKKMNEKLEAVTVRVLKVLEQHEHNEMQAKNRVSVGINTAREPPVGNYAGEIIIDLNTQERYTIVKFLGDGSFGQVFKATDSDERTFAIKVYTDAVSAEDTQRQLSVALRAAVERGDHPPRFLSVSDYFDGLVFGEPKTCEKMECFALDVFEALYERNTIFTPLQTLQVVAQISTALAYLHSHDYIHVDVKPDNLMLTNMDILDGKIDARLIDFDTVLKMTGQPTVFCGQSVPYRSPEMALEIPCDGKLDVFSLGLVALQMVTGRRNGFHMIWDTAVEGFEEWETNAAVLAEIHSLISPIPHDLLQRSSAFRDVTEFKKIAGRNKKTMEEICTNLESSSDGARLSAVIRSMLIIDPQMRPSAAVIAENLAEFCTPEQHEI